MNIVMVIIMGVFVGFLKILADKNHSGLKSFNVGIVSTLGSSILGIFAHQIDTIGTFPKQILGFIFIVTLFLILQKLLSDIFSGTYISKGGEMYGRSQ